jgi:ribosomal protein S18 acetylase RimI-like enzyme
MIVASLEPIKLQNIQTFKVARLRALLDSPSAFGSTYARESMMSDVEWVQRVMRWNGTLGVGFWAVEQQAVYGIAGALLDEKDLKKAQLVSMWTAPEHRQLGVGRMLVEAVIGWARKAGVERLNLIVTSRNQGAILFYQRLGFAITGRSEPYPNNPALVEYEMSRSIL